MIEKFKKSISKIASAAIIAGTISVTEAKTPHKSPEKHSFKGDISILISHLKEKAYRTNSPFETGVSSYCNSDGTICYNLSGLSTKKRHEIDSDFLNALDEELRNVYGSELDNTEISLTSHTHSILVLLSSFNNIVHPKSVPKNKWKDLLSGPSITDCVSIEETGDELVDVNLIAEPGGLWVCGTLLSEKDTKNLERKLVDKLDIIRDKLYANSILQNSDKIKESIHYFESQYFEITGIKIKYLSYEEATTTKVSEEIRKVAFQKKTSQN